MHAAAPSPPDELGGRVAQVFEPSNHWLASFGGLAAAVQSAWSAETAWIDDWDHALPARGQCGTSALVLQDNRGGGLMRGLVHETGRSSVPTVHYWNVVDQRHVDLTWQQFSEWSFVLRSETIHRDELLVTPWLIERYAVLRSRLDAGSLLQAPTGGESGTWPNSRHRLSSDRLPTAVPDQPS